MVAPSGVASADVQKQNGTQSNTASSYLASQGLTGNASNNAVNQAAAEANNASRFANGGGGGGGGSNSTPAGSQVLTVSTPAATTTTSTTGITAATSSAAAKASALQASGGTSALYNYIANGGSLPAYNGGSYYLYSQQINKLVNSSPLSGNQNTTTIGSTVTNNPTSSILLTSQGSTNGSTSSAAAKASALQASGGTSALYNYLANGGSIPAYSGGSYYSYTQKLNNLVNSSSSFNNNTQGSTSPAQSALASSIQSQTGFSASYSNFLARTALLGEQGVINPTGNVYYQYVNSGKITDQNYLNSIGSATTYYNAIQNQVQTQAQGGLVASSSFISEPNFAGLLLGKINYGGSSPTTGTPYTVEFNYGGVNYITAGIVPAFIQEGNAEVSPNGNTGLLNNYVISNAYPSLAPYFTSLGKSAGTGGSVFLNTQTGQYVITSGAIATKGSLPSGGGSGVGGGGYQIVNGGAPSYYGYGVLRNAPVQGARFAINGSTGKSGYYQGSTSQTTTGLVNTAQYGAPPQILPAGTSKTTKTVDIFNNSEGLTALATAGTNTRSTTAALPFGNVTSIYNTTAIAKPTSTQYSLLFNATGQKPQAQSAITSTVTNFNVKTNTAVALKSYVGNQYNTKSESPQTSSTSTYNLGLNPLSEGTQGTRGFVFSNKSPIKIESVITNSGTTNIKPNVKTVNSNQITQYNIKSLPSSDFTVSLYGKSYNSFLQPYTVTTTTKVIPEFTGFAQNFGLPLSTTSTQSGQLSATQAKNFTGTSNILNSTGQSGFLNTQRAVAGLETLTGNIGYGLFSPQATITQKALAVETAGSVIFPLAAGADAIALLALGGVAGANFYAGSDYIGGEPVTPTGTLESFGFGAATVGLFKGVDVVGSQVASEALSKLGYVPITRALTAGLFVDTSRDLEVGDITPTATGRTGVVAIGRSNSGADYLDSINAKEGTYNTGAKTSTKDFISTSTYQIKIGANGDVTYAINKNIEGLDYISVKNEIAMQTEDLLYPSPKSSLLARNIQETALPASKTPAVINEFETGKSTGLIRVKQFFTNKQGTVNAEVTYEGNPLYDTTLKGGFTKNNEPFSVPNGGTIKILETKLTVKNTGLVKFFQPTRTITLEGGQGYDLLTGAALTVPRQASLTNSVPPEEPFRPFTQFTSPNTVNTAIPAVESTTGIVENTNIFNVAEGGGKGGLFTQSSPVSGKDFLTTVKPLSEYTEGDVNTVVRAIANKAGVNGKLKNVAVVDIVRGDKGLDENLAGSTETYGFTKKGAPQLLTKVDNYLYSKGVYNGANIQIKSSLLTSEPNPRLSSYGMFTTASTKEDIFIQTATHEVIHVAKPSYGEADTVRVARQTFSSNLKFLSGVTKPIKVSPLIAPNSAFLQGGGLPIEIPSAAPTEEGIVSSLFRGGEATPYEYGEPILPKSTIASGANKLTVLQVERVPASVSPKVSAKFTDVTTSRYIVTKSGGDEGYTLYGAKLPVENGIINVEKAPEGNLILKSLGTNEANQEFLVGTRTEGGITQGVRYTRYLGGQKELETTQAAMFQRATSSLNYRRIEITYSSGGTKGGVAIVTSAKTASFLRTGAGSSLLRLGGQTNVPISAAPAELEVPIEVSFSDMGRLSTTDYEFGLKYKSLFGTQSNRAVGQGRLASKSGVIYQENEGVPLDTRLGLGGRSIETSKSTAIFVPSPKTDFGRDISLPSKVSLEGYKLGTFVGLRSIYEISNKQNQPSGTRNINKVIQPSIIGQTNINNTKTGNTSRILNVTRNTQTSRQTTKQTTRNTQTTQSITSNATPTTIPTVPPTAPPLIPIGLNQTFFYKPLARGSQRVGSGTKYVPSLGGLISGRTITAAQEKQFEQGAGAENTFIRYPIAEKSNKPKAFKKGRLF